MSGAEATAPAAATATVSAAAGMEATFNKQLEFTGMASGSDDCSPTQFVQDDISRSATDRQRKNESAVEYLDRIMQALHDFRCPQWAEGDRTPEVGTGTLGVKPVSARVVAKLEGNREYRQDSDCALANSELEGIVHQQEMPQQKDSKIAEISDNSEERNSESVSAPQQKDSKIAEISDDYEERNSESVRAIKDSMTTENNANDGKGRNNAVYSKNTKCHYCKRKGHFIRECRTRQAAEASKANVAAPSNAAQPGSVTHPPRAAISAQRQRHLVAQSHSKVLSSMLQFSDMSFVSACSMAVDTDCKTDQIVGARLFINIFCNRQRIKALYDTGAAVSVISTNAFKIICGSGTSVEPISHAQFPNLATASGGRMQIVGIYNVRMTVCGRSFTAPLVVSPDIANQCIIGMNIIRGCGLVYDPGSETVGYRNDPFPEQQLPPVDEVTLADFQPTNLVLMKPVTVPPHTARLVKVALAAADSSNRVLQKGEYLADVAGIAIAFRTSQYGTCSIYLPNASDDDMQFERGAVLGAVSPRDSTNVVTTTEQVAVITATAKEQEKQLAPPTSTHSKEQLLAQVKTQIAKSVNVNLPPAERKNYIDMLYQHVDVFSTSQHDIGRTDTVVHDVKVRDREPVYTQQYRLPFEQLQIIRDHVGAWLKSGVVERAHSKYNSPIFCVPKKEGQGYRPVLDYRKLNAKSLPDKYSIRPIDQCIEEVGMAGSKIFSCLDLKSGFWQMLLKEQARPYTAFTVPGVGQFQWVTAPMGLMGSPASFSRLMEVVMRDLSNIITYIDDCLVHSRTHAEHWQHLKAALDRLRLHGLKLNADKCLFAARTVQYLGHTLSDKGISPGFDKTRAIRESRPPTTTRQLKSFMGLCNYFRCYIRDFAHIANPLYKLTRQDSEWPGGELPPAALTAFNTLQQSICAQPVLKYPTRNGKYHLFVDAAIGDAANEGGLGAVLMQDDEAGEKHPVAYASRRLVSHEANYPAFLLEMQAAVYGMETFEHYLRGRAFCPYSDHKPLVKLSTVHTKTLNRLQLKMQEMYPEMRYVPGKENTVADFLSRYHGLGIAQVDASQFRIATLQQQDTEVARVWQDTWRAANEKEDTPVRLPGHRHLTLIRNRILCIQLGPKVGRVASPTLRVVAPGPMRPELIKEAHNSVLCGHGGVFKTAERISSEFWWPHMAEDISRHIQQCAPCQANTSKGVLPPAPLTPLPVPQGPNHRVHVDLFGPLKAREGGSKYILVMTDALTKIVRLKIIESKDASVVAQAILKDWVYIFGVPRVICSDQGREFCNDLARAIWTSLGVTHSVTTPYHPQTNAQAEVFNKTMAHYLRTALAESKKSTLDWELYVAPLMFAYNTAVHKSTLQSPFYTTFGYDPRVPLWDKQDLLRDDEKVTDRSQAQVLFDIRRTQAAARQIAHTNLQHAQQQQMQGYERSFNPQLSVFEPGAPVWVRNTLVSASNQKLAPGWEEGTVVERLTAATYKVRRDARSRKKHATINIQRLKPRVPAVDTGPNPPEPAPPTSTPPEEVATSPRTPAQTPAPGSTAPAPPFAGRITRARAKSLAQAIVCSLIMCPDDVDDLTVDDIFRLADLGWLPTFSGGSGGMPQGCPATSSGPAAGPAPSSSVTTEVRDIAGPSSKSHPKTKRPRMLSRLTDYLLPHSKPIAAPGPSPIRIRASRSLMRRFKK